MTTTTTTPAAVRIDDMTRDQIKAAVRAATPGEKVFTEWRIANGLPQHSGDMTKAQWIVAHAYWVTGDATPVTPAPKAEPKPKAEPAPKAAPKAEKAKPVTPAKSDPFKDAENFLSDKALAPLKKAYDDAMSEAKKQTARAERAEKLANDKALEAHNAKAATPAPAPAPVAGPVAAFVEEKNLADLMPGRVSDDTRNREIMLPLCDFEAAPQIDPNYVWPANTPDICTAASLDMSICLYGPKGSGKSSFWRQVAAISKRPHIEIAFHGEISHADLFGFEGPAPDGGTQWVMGDLLKAVTTPYAIVDCAEIAKSRPDMVTALNSVFESSQRAIFAGGKWHHFAPGVWLVASSNDNGTGETAGQYHGVKPMDESLRSRLVWFQVELPGKTQLSRMLNKVANVQKDAADMLADLELSLLDAVRKGDCETSPGFRALVAMAKLVKSGMDAKAAFDVAALNSAVQEDRALWADMLNATFDLKRFTILARGGEAKATRNGFTATE